MSFFKLLLNPRSLLALALTLAACWFVGKHVPHHEGKNAFETLYLHLVPAPLVKDNTKHHFEREDYLLTLPAPGFLSALAINQGEEHGSDGHGDDHGDSHDEESSHAEGDHAESAGHDDDHAAAGHSEGHDGDGHAASADGHDGHGEEPYIAFSNLQVFQVLAVLLVLIFFSGVPRYLRTGKGDAVSQLFAGFAHWLRDEVVVPVMGKEMGSKFLPYFLCLFFFILFMNLLGLIPGSATATASIYVTAALALTTLAAMIGCGMAAQGPLAFWKNLVPHVPAALWPLMFVVELIGLAVKPFALMIRMFANMTGGHMVVLSFMGLIFFFGMSPDFGKNVGLAVSPVAVGFGVFIMIIETFVALLQAFIFTQLSVIFVGASVHPEH